MTPNNQYVQNVKRWLLEHWTDWCWVMPGNGVAFFELLKELKKEGVIRSLESSQATVKIALRMARKERQKPDFESAMKKLDPILTPNK